MSHDRHGGAVSYKPVANVFIFHTILISLLVT